MTALHAHAGEPSRTLVRSAVPILLLLLAGCESGPPIVEVGTGTATFEPLEDGQSVPLIEGAQGGWHVWVSIRARGVDPTDVKLDVITYPREAGRPRQTRLHALDLTARDGWYERVGLVQVLSLPECYQDREVVVSVDATDRAGRTAHDQRVVVPRWPTPIGDCAP